MLTISSFLQACAAPYTVISLLTIWFQWWEKRAHGGNQLPQHHGLLLRSPHSDFTPWGFQGSLWVFITGNLIITEERGKELQQIAVRFRQNEFQPAETQEWTQLAALHICKTKSVAQSNQGTVAWPAAEFGLLSLSDEKSGKNSLKLHALSRGQQAEGSPIEKK